MTTPIRKGQTHVYVQQRQLNKEIETKIGKYSYKYLIMTVIYKHANLENTRTRSTNHKIYHKEGLIATQGERGNVQ